MTIINIFSLLIISIVSAIGILADIFIVAVNLLDWVQGRPLNTCDQILSCLGTSSSCFKFLMLGQTYMYIIWKDIFVYIPLAMVQLRMWTSFATYLLTACLCVFYCVKIVDFNHHLLFWLKLRISRVVPWAILGSVVGSLVLSAPVYWATFCDVSKHPTANLTDDCITSSGEVTLLPAQVIVAHALGFFLPLLLAVVSISLILASLYRHTRRMKGNASGFSPPRLEAHIGAARMVGGLLLIYIPLLLGEGIKLAFLNTFWVTHLVWVIIVCSSSAQSAILILGNTKLRQAFRKVLSSWRQGGTFRVKKPVNTENC